MRSCTLFILTVCLLDKKITPECAVARCRGLHPLWEVPFFRQEFSVYRLCLKSELCSLTGNNTNIHSCIKNVIWFTTVAMVTCILSLPDSCVILFFSLEISLPCNIILYSLMVGFTVWGRTFCGKPESLFYQIGLYMENPTYTLLGESEHSCGCNFKI